MSKVFSFIGETVISDLEFRHCFPVFHRETEQYRLRFIQGLFYRRLEVDGSDAVKLQKLYHGTEVWTHIFRPWLKWEITNLDLLNAVDYLQVAISGIKRSEVDANVIKKPPHFWRRNNPKDF